MRKWTSTERDILQSERSEVEKMSEGLAEGIVSEGVERVVLSAAKQAMTSGLGHAL